MKYKMTKTEIFDNIYRTYRDEVYHAVLYRLNDKELAEDMTHQAFMNYFKGMERLNVHPKCMKQYLISAALNQAKNYFRSKEHEFLLEEDFDHDKTVFPELVTESMEEHYVKQYEEQMREQLSDKIMDDLKEHNKDWHYIFQKMFFENEDHDKIARELGITKSVLYSRLYRAKECMRKKYQLQFDKIEE